MNALPPLAAALAAIHAQAFGDAAWSAGSFASLLAGPGVFALLDARGGAVLARVAADEAEILTIGVAPAARRHGIATELMRAAMAQARQRGAARLFLEVAESNHPARGLYASLGFAQAGRRCDYYVKNDGAEDALVLAVGL